MIQKRSQVLKPLNARIAEVEAAIAGLEKEKAALLQELCDPLIIGDNKVYPSKLQRQRQVEQELESLLAEWTELNEQAEQVVLG